MSAAIITVSIKTIDTHTDKELIQLWQKGNDSAFETLYHRYAVELLKIAMLKTNDREIAGELLQNVFITFFNNKNSAHQIASPMAYLYTILKNRILDHHRHDLIHRKYRDHTSYHNGAVAANDVSNYIETKELELLLNAEVKKLPPQCENVFRLRREHELSNREIARRLNISENTVEQHMRKALRLLKHALQVMQSSLFTIFF